MHFASFKGNLTLPFIAEPYFNTFCLTYHATNALQGGSPAIQEAIGAMMVITDFAGQP